MIFKNRPNKSYEVTENNIKKLVWESRSVAVNCVVVISNDEGIFILVSKRGPKAADFQGKLNVVAGYLDWDETGTEAVYRETWEECGLDLLKFKKYIIFDDLSNPWNVKTEPDENRQNVSLRYGIVFHLDEFPTLSLEHNEIEGEIESAWWMPLKNINNYEWAFCHNEVILEYLKFTNK